MTALIAWLIIGLSPVFCQAQSSSIPLRPRIVVTADPELDDNNSLIRFLLYSSDVEVEGLVYASSGFHWKGDGKGTRWYVPGREYARFGLDTCPCPSWRWAKDERFIHDAVDAYAKVYPNLKVHNKGYPSPEQLKSRIRYGNIEFDGDISKDSPGSELIESLILDDKPGPLFITAWGGHSTIARALKSIQGRFEHTERWPALKGKISRKVVLLPSGDQDDTYMRYIRPNWPDIEYRQFQDAPNYGYGAQIRSSPVDSPFLTSSWMRANVSSRGPLGALYRVWGDGKQMVKGDRLDYFGLSGYATEQLRNMGYAVWLPVQVKGSWLGEGDNATFMNMLDNGLRAYEDGSYGGWGGRKSQRQPGSFFAAGDTSQKAMADALSGLGDRAGSGSNPLPDFFPAAQNDFAARLKWSVTKSYADANHEPVVRIEGPLEVMAAPGETIRLNASVSDPDGNRVSLLWRHIRVGTYPGKVAVSDERKPSCRLHVPKDAVPGQTIHIIVEATDEGVPPLTRYQRVVVTVKRT